MGDFFAAVFCIGLFICTVIGWVKFWDDPIADAIKAGRICVSETEHGVKFEKCWKLVEMEQSK